MKDTLGFVTPLIDKRLALAKVASDFVGIKESGGDNKGEWIERFQKAVDGKALQEAWCCAFAMFCLKAVQEQLEGPHGIFETEHVMTCWNKTDQSRRAEEPEIGDLVCWSFGGGKGHIGIVYSVIDENSFVTVEGNTSDGKGIVREGDGVYFRNRSKKSSDKFKLLGFLRPF